MSSIRSWWRDVIHDTAAVKPDSVNLFGEPVQDKTILVFHDESGDYGRDEWVFTGLLWLREERAKDIDEVLKQARGEYLGEIHFSDLPASFDGDFAADARVARDWMNIFKAQWACQTWFNVLAINRNHPRYEHHRFTRDFHAYNRFTAMALKAGLAWHFNDVASLQLRIYSDEKSRRPQGLLSDGVTTDNFERYLANRLSEDTQRYKGPKVQLAEPVHCLSCPKKGPFAAEQEVLQLTDLLLGSVATAVDPKSGRMTKLWFGKETSALIRDTRLAPRKQRRGLYRRFSVSYFPDKSGCVYNDGQLKSEDSDSQMRLF